MTEQRRAKRPSFTDIKERRDSLGNVEDFSRSLKLPREEGGDKGYDALVKFLLLGDSGVGKSCLLLRFCDDTFTPSFITTVGIDFKIRTIKLDGKRIKLQVWDTAGQERFRTITNAYYRGAMGILLIYDITNEESFNAVANTWLPNVHNLAPEGVSLMLVGHKCDASDQERIVSNDSGHILASSHKMQFCEASAKSDTNVDWAFASLTRQVMARSIVEEKDKIVTLDSAADETNHEELANKNDKTTKCCK